MVKDKINVKADKNASSAEKKKKSRFLTTFICIFLGVVIVLGGVMGVMIGVRNARALVRYDNVTMDEGVVNYFASRLKDLYLDRITPSADNDAFWSTDAGEGKTHGEILREQFHTYISDIAVANRLFYKYSSLTIADEECIAKSVDWFMRLHAGGSVATFNNLAQPYGFDYDDFVKATEMQYKAEKAKLVIYGASGENLGADTESDRCYTYLQKYSHVALVFIGTEYKNVWNGETGKLDKELIGEAELDERHELIDRIDTLITNLMEDNEGDWMSTDYFESLLGSYESDPDMKECGYYFRRGTEYTEIFYERFAPVVDKALEMEIGEYARVDLNVEPEGGDYGFVGTCFIYKYEPQWGAWLDKDNLFLSDFLPLASNYYYTEDLKEFSEDVIFSEAFKLIDPLATPRNDRYYVAEWR